MTIALFTFLFNYNLPIHLPIQLLSPCSPPYSIAMNLYQEMNANSDEADAGETAEKAVKKVQEAIRKSAPHQRYSVGLGFQVQSSNRKVTRAIVIE